MADRRQGSRGSLQGLPELRRLLRSGWSLSRGPIARSSIQSLAIKIAGLAISLGQAMLAARLLGASGYGIAAVVLAAVQIMATFAALGYGQLAIRELARQSVAGSPDAVVRFIRTSSSRVALVAVLAGGALSATALLGPTPEDYRTALAIGGLIVLPLAALQLLRGIAQGLGRVAAAQMPGDLLRPALLVLLLVPAVLVQVSLNPEVYLVAFAASALVAFAVALFPTLCGVTRQWAARPDAGEVSRLRTEAWPFLAIGLVGILMGEINTLMLGWLASPREAGLYQPIARLVPLMVLPVQAAGMRFAPRISELWELGRLDEIERLRRVFTISTLALTSLVALSLAAAGPWVLALFGPEFQASAVLLWIIAGAQVFNAACGPVGMLLVMRGRTFDALVGQAAGLLVNCGIGLFLIRSHGALGAAIATAAGIVTWNLLLLGRLRYAADRIGSHGSGISGSDGPPTTR